MRTSAIVASLLIGASAAPSNDDKMLKITEGILKGALDAEGFTDITQCIKDGEEIVQDAEAAYKDFEGHSASEIVDGLKKVADAIKTIKAGMSDCSHLKADWEKLEAMAAVFSNPSSFAFHVAKDLLVNGVDIYHEINTAIGDYKSEDWMGFGENVGMAAAKVLIGSEQAQKEAAIAIAAEDNKKMLAEATAGMLNEFGGKFNLWELLGCIQYEDEAAIALTLGVKSLETAAGEWNTDRKQAVQDVFGGLIAIFAAYQQAKQGVPICESVVTKINKLEEYTHVREVLRHPFEHFQLLEDDLQINGYSIMYDIQEAIAAFNHKDYSQFGHIMGKIMKLAVKEKAGSNDKFVLQAAAPETSFKRYDITEVFQGFLAGAGVGQFNFLDLLLCIDTADKAAEMLYQDVSMFEEAWKEKDVMEGVAASVILLGFVKSVQQQVLPVCESVDKNAFNWTKFDKMYDTFEDPVNHINAIEHNVVMNGKTITAEFKGAMADFHDKKYHSFGYKMAQALMSATDFEEDKHLFLY